MKWNTLQGAAPRVIAHRGASGYRPEHTLDGYTLAASQGGDVLEPDLTMSRDGVLFARHDLGLNRSTDIASRREFANRAREVAGVRDWWISDFTAAEIDSLRAIQPVTLRDQQFNGRFVVPRFSMVLDLLATLTAQHARTLSLYPELKHPRHFTALGLDPVDALRRELEPRGWLGEASPVWIQCFDHAVLRTAKTRCGNLCFALLETTTLQPGSRDKVLADLATWASGVAPNKFILWDNTGADTGFVAAAHSHGLEVHAWTFRDDHPSAPFADSRAEMDAAFELGVDALFCDFPDTAIAARDAFVNAMR
ncbi:MAG: glycerophosphodiester phosphodiesterase family protein [Rudaea sp.]